MCTALSTTNPLRASERAIAENPDNAPDTMPSLRSPLVAERVAAFAKKLWSAERARTLRVRFMGGRDDLQERVAEMAKEWEQHANVRFVFGVRDPDAEIRVAFEERGHWSFVGTDALEQPRDQPTLNIQTSVLVSQSALRRTVLHEFGHALGAIHEHQNPDVGIRWNRARVFEYYRRTQGWDKRTTTANILRAYDFSSANFSEYDPASIMHYPVDKALTEDGFSVGWNSALSEQDKRFIGTQYPHKERTSRAVRVGEMVSADIGSFGEVDRYHFILDKTDVYQLDTLGPTDVTMALYGPDDPTRLIGSDDDSGQGRNARLVYRLPPGTYHVKIRHQHGGVGAYKLYLWRH